jgi:hypothetical protein
MHYQLAPPKPSVEIRGGLYDLILDLREGSPTFGASFGAELTSENRRMMYVPKGFAHGFITLADNTEAFYFVDEFYSPEHERGVRYDDPMFKLHWPAAPTVVSDKDKSHRSFDPAWHWARGREDPVHRQQFVLTTGLKELTAAAMRSAVSAARGNSKTSDKQTNSPARPPGVWRLVWAKAFYGVDKKAIGLLCHHAAEVANYKSADSTLPVRRKQHASVADGVGVLDRYGMSKDHSDR